MKKVSSADKALFIRGQHASMINGLLNRQPIYGPVVRYDIITLDYYFIFIYNKFLLICLALLLWLPSNLDLWPLVALLILKTCKKMGCFTSLFCLYCWRVGGAVGGLSLFKAISIFCSLLTGCWLLEVEFSCYFPFDMKAKHLYF